jgi:hypothetical protein
VLSDDDEVVCDVVDSCYFVVRVMPKRDEKIFDLFYDDNDETRHMGSQKCPYPSAVLSILNATVT